MGPVARNRHAVVPWWSCWALLVGASVQQNGTVPPRRSGYEFVDPLIGTTNGGKYRNPSVYGEHFG